MSGPVRLNEPDAAAAVVRYAWIARGGLAVALAGAVGFVFVVRGSLFTPDTTNWPLVACVGSWALGMGAALVARSRIRAMGRDARSRIAETRAEDDRVREETRS